MGLLTRNKHLEEYRDAVTDLYTPLKDEILSYYQASEEDVISTVTCLHHYVQNQIDYRWRDHSTEDLQEFEETFYNGGNCEEQSVLLASLLNPIPEIDCRFIAVEGPDTDHLLLEIRFLSQDPDHVTHRIRETFRENSYDRMPYDPGDIYWENYDNDPWFITDPEHSRWIGDMETLFSHGYANQTDDGWQWNSVKYHGEVE